MATPYREGAPPQPLKCPRCKKRELPPLEVAACPGGCGTWVSVFAAPEVLTEVDRRRDPVTRWWRMREPCPMCSEKMALCGDDPALLQGCELHGYFVDADTIAKTGLARGVDLTALAAKLDPDRLAAERERLLRLEQQRAKDAADQQRKEADVARRVVAVDDRTVDPTSHAGRVHHLVQIMIDNHPRMLAEYIVALEDRIAALEAKP